METSTGFPAPAVASAMRILHLLAHDVPRAGVSEIARSLGLNKSTCFNILVTLQHYGAVAKMPGEAKYQLGPKLLELGAAVRRNFSRRGQIRRHLQPLVEETGIAGAIGQVLGDGTEFVVIDRIAPPGDGGLAPPVGHVYPLTAPAMGRALLSQLDEEEAIDLVRRKLGTLVPDAEAEWRAQLAAIRTAGYAISDEHYRPGISAVAVPLIAAGEAQIVLALVGHTETMRRLALDALGRRLIAVARALEAAPVSHGDAPT